MTLSIQPDPTVDLVDVATARAWIGAPALADGQSDPVMQLAITAVSQRIASWCSRPFVAAVATEIYDGTDTDLLCLRRFPVTAVAAVSINGVPVPVTAAPAGYGITCDGRRALAFQGGFFSRGRQNVAVTYTAGFDPIPADLMMACLDWVAAGYLARGRAPDVAERKDGDSSEKYATAGAVVTVAGRTVPMPPSVFATLSQYQDTLPV